MTHSHALDLDLVIAALQAERFPYVGLIGSATKRARFTSAMRKMGMAAEAIGKLVCPIGLTDDPGQGAGGDRGLGRRAGADGARGGARALRTAIAERKPGRARHG